MLPSIILAMKVEKMTPNGRMAGDVVKSDAARRAPAWADFMAADQKKTKRYMVPSKAVEMIPSTRMRRSARTIENPDFSDVDDEEALSPWFSD